MTTSPLSYGPFISRAQAKEQCLKQFFTGVACKRGHIAVRSVSSTGCFECQSEKRRKPVVLHSCVCAVCGKEFESRRAAKYCSKQCGTAGWRLENKEHIKAYNAAQTPDHKKAYQARKAKRLADPAYDAKRKAVHKRCNAKWFADNRDRMNEYRRGYEADRYVNDLQYKLKHNLRTRVGSALRAQLTGKDWSLMDIIGCSTDELIAHLEAQFLPGMSWDNWAHDGWHVDHIRPCASFDLTDPEQQKQCFHYTNLQPLWAADNIRKSDTWEPVAA